MARRKRRPYPRPSPLARYVRRLAAKPPALPPGTPVHTGEQLTRETSVEVFNYDRERFESFNTTASAECLRVLNAGGVTWLHVTGLHETEKITEIGQSFGMHPLLVEDVLNTHGRSKLDEWEDRIFLTLRMLAFDAAAHRLENQRLSIFFAPGVVITFVEEPTRIFEPVFQRIRSGGGRIRTMPVDYLAWAVLDAVVDHYFQVADAIDERLTDIDAGLQDGFDDLEIAQLYRMHSEVVAFHRWVRPIREIASALSHSDSTLLSADTDIFYRDLYDHAVHLVEQCADLHEHANSLREFFLATVNNRMNEVIKVLTSVSTIFLPLTFLAGVYGMNFKHLPEYEWRYGYLLFWIVSAIIAVIMIWYFRRRRWL
jgi:magnesium transporter